MPAPSSHQYGKHLVMLHWVAWFNGGSAGSRFYHWVKNMAICQTPTGIVMLLVPRGSENEASWLFARIDISITSGGLRYLCSPVGTEKFTRSHVNSSEAQWSANMKACADVAEFQLHVAYHNLLPRLWNHTL